MYVEGFRELYRFPGYAVHRARIDPAIAEVQLRRDRRFKLTCPHCGGRMSESRRKPQIVRDLGLGPMPVTLICYPAIQGRCRACGCYATALPRTNPCRARRGPSERSAAGPATRTRKRAVVRSTVR